MIDNGSPSPPINRGRSFDDRILTSGHQQQRSSDASSEDEFGLGVGRPALVRRKTGDELPRSRPALPTRKPVVRSMSGDPSGDARRAMMNKRAMSTRDFGGGRGGRGLAMARAGPGRGGMMAQKSMSTRLLGAASDFTRMASTRALFMDEPEEEPSIIMYMGREIKVEDHFDEEWIEDALDEEAGLKNHSNRMSMSNNSSSRRGSQEDNSRRSQNSSNWDGSHREEESDDEGSEVEEDMEEMEEDTSANHDGPKRRGRRGSRRTSNNKRSQSVEAPAARPSRPPGKRGVFRSRTFDGRQTSEILPRRRKPKNRSVKQLVRPKADLNKQYKEFLARTGGITPTGNQPYQNYEDIIIIPRRQPKYPTSRKKVEQFRRLEYTAEDIQDVLCEDDDTFQRLKRVLTKKGAITNGVLQQRLHIFLKKAKDRQSKLAQQRKEEGKEETDNTTNLQVTQPDWAAMSMMDMFAHSVRKLTSDTTTTTTTPSPTAAAAGGGAAGGGDEEPKFQRRALPRMQAVMAKRNKMQANKASRTLMTTFAEEDEEGEESSNHDNSAKENNSQRVVEEEEEEEKPRRSPSPFRRSRGASPAPSPIRRPKPSSSSAFISTRDSAGNNALHKDMDDVMQPKELPVTSSKPMELDLSLPRELPVTNNKPMELDLNSKFKGTPQRAREELSMEPKCLDDELSASQRPMQLDLRQSFQDLPLQPKCLDDELSASQRPMELDLKQNFQDLQPKCLDDPTSDKKPMTLDLSGSGDQPLLFTPKNLDNDAREDADLLFQPKNLDESHNKMDSSRARRRHRPSKIRRNMSSGSGASTRSSISGSGKGATPTRSRARRAKSMQDDPPPLEIKCLDDQPPSRTGSSGSRNSASKPAPPGLLVGWNH